MKRNRLTSLNGIEIELDDFEGRQTLGVPQSEYDAISVDWYMCASIPIRAIIKNSDFGNSSEKQKLKQLIARMRSLKQNIIEVGYDYPFVIDPFDVSILD